MAVCAAGGSTGSTTTSLLLAAMSPEQHPALLAECDPDGGDVAAWAQVQPAPGWATAASASDRTLAGLLAHTQLVSGLPALLSPSRPSQARSAVREGAVGFSGLLAGTPEVLTYADWSLVALEASVWARAAQLTLLLVRQVPGSAPATVARVDRAIEAVEVLRGACSQVGVVLVGGAPYGAREVASVLGVELSGCCRRTRLVRRRCVVVGRSAGARRRPRWRGTRWCWPAGSSRRSAAARISLAVRGWCRGERAAQRGGARVGG